MLTSEMQCWPRVFGFPIGEPRHPRHGARACGVVSIPRGDSSLHSGSGRLHDPEFTTSQSKSSSSCHSADPRRVVPLVVDRAFQDDGTSHEVRGTCGPGIRGRCGQPPRFRREVPCSLLPSNPTPHRQPNPQESPAGIPIHRRPLCYLGAASPYTATRGCAARSRATRRFILHPSSFILFLTQTSSSLAWPSDRRRWRPA
jgi:hypothetical protein